MEQPTDHLDKPTELRHLLRMVKTSLELAIIARAPADIVNRLGKASGLLDAVSQLPIEQGPAHAMVPELMADGMAAVAMWQRWEKERAPAA